MEQSISLDTPDKIAGARVLALKSALSLETKGMKMSRGRSAYAIVKEEFGFKGSKEKVYRQLQRYIWDNLLPLPECAVFEENEGWVLVKRGETGFWPWKHLEFTDNDGNDLQVRPEDFNKDRGATDKEQRDDMLAQSMFGWRKG